MPVGLASALMNLAFQRQHTFPKDALPFNDLQVPKTGGNYMITSVPQYDDITALRQLVNEITGEGKKGS